MPVGQKHIFQRARRIAVGDVNHFAAERKKRVQPHDAGTAKAALPIRTSLRQRAGGRRLYVLIVGRTSDWARTRELRNRRVETFEDGHFAPLRESRNSYGKNGWLAARRSVHRVSPMSCSM